jgi:hypothetical protein
MDATYKIKQSESSPDIRVTMLAFDDTNIRSKQYQHLYQQFLGMAADSTKPCGPEDRGETRN